MDDSTIQALTSLLSKRLSAPLPHSYEDRVKALESYLNEVNRVVPFDSKMDYASATPERITQVMQIRVISDVIREFKMLMADGAGMSDCDKAAVKGLAEITVGALTGGPLGAVAGFALGLVELALEC